jgi:ferredoxin
MRILIIYFSGTGNTKAIAQGYQVALSKRGHIVTIKSIEETQDLDEHELLIIGGPIYAGYMPDKLINWTRKNVTKVTEKQAIVFSTSAGLSNANGVKSIGKKLIRKGYTLLDMAKFEMPRNFYIDKYEPTDEGIQKLQFENAGAKIIDSINCLDKSSSLSIEESVIMNDFLSDFFRLLAKNMGKSFKIHENCINCGLCEKNCPQNNIKYKEKQYLNRCIMCTRCIHNCPVNAISYKGKHIEQYKVHYEVKTDKLQDTSLL